jgi:diguanylate cyclase (GGDEF)-like protein/PAS domain S-box-containing protein
LAETTGSLEASTLAALGQAVVVNDLQRRILYWNRAAEEMFGWSAAEALGRDVVEIVRAGEDPERDASIFRRVAKGEKVAAEYAMVRRDGRRFAVLSIITPVMEQGRLVAVASVATDITERVQMEAARREAEERFRLGFERGAVAAAMLDLAAFVTRVNPAMCVFLDRTEDEIVGHQTAEFIHPDDRDAVVTRERVVRGDRAPFERRFLRKNGTEVWGLVNMALVRNDDDTPAYLFAQVQDITERKSAEQMLEHMALHDPLTGLPNRVLLQDRLEGALARAAHYGRRVGVIFGDIDRFKLVNDTLGHAAGDQLLVQLAVRLLSLARPSDTVGRFSGDEFVMICEDLPAGESTDSIGSRMSAAFDRPFHVADRDLYLTVSAGIVLPGSEEEAATCFRDGAVAMHQAKEHGRGRAEPFDKDMLSRAARLLDLESALRLAVEHGDLRLAYQPIIDLTTGQTIAVEALCRWRHPERGEIGPAEFIPVAEQSGLIGPIGRFVIDESIRQIGMWRDELAGAADLWVSINLSSAQVSSELVALCEQLVERDAEGGSFGFEITESVLMADISAAIDVLRRLRQLGIPVSIDDFGTGYSSLEYLKLLPVQSLKIDQSFVAGLGLRRDTDDPSIVQAVIALARALSMGACAEGVETEEQRHALLALGCEKAQGYLWSRPLAPADFEQWYREHGAGDASIRT